jgi:RNA polymerase sigma-70 factor (ECF subfamily)
MISSSSHNPDRFATTRWSVVMHAAATTAGEAQVALAELVQRYWYPVYVYARRSGHSPAIAEDIARAFIGSLMRDFRGDRAGSGRGEFRRYLLERLNAFLGGDWREIADVHGDEDSPAPSDLEARYLQDLADAESKTPEQAYEHAFALEVIARALRRLRSEAQRAGHEAMYAALEPFLAREPVPGELDLATQSLSSRPLALIVALKRLRQRLRELAGEELADTVASREQLQAEQATLHAILTRKSRSP